MEKKEKKVFLKMKVKGRRKKMRRMGRREKRRTKMMKMTTVTMTMMKMMMTTMTVMKVSWDTKWMSSPNFANLAPHVHSP